MVGTNKRKDPIPDEGFEDFREETKVLSGLQQLRGSVLTGYAALYTVMGDISRSRSEESMDRLIETVSGGEGPSGR